MGGRVSMSKLVDASTKLPMYFHEIRAQQLYTSSVPTHRAQLIRFASEYNVGLVATLLTKPLRNGRNENWCGDKECEFVDLSHDMVENLPKDLQLGHYPVEDGTLSCAASLRRFMRDAIATRKRGKAVLVHCWRGEGRTGFFGGALLRVMEQKQPQDVIDELRKMNYRMFRWEKQRDVFLSPNYLEKTDDDDERVKWLKESICKPSPQSNSVAAEPVLRYDLNTMAASEETTPFKTPSLEEMLATIEQGLKEQVPDSQLTW
eukprot:TRINITY_DN12083_c0_g1_i1.p1 TRINITY_DN12083_c0_g1~~TRINITY_DN12083_c0_g1_i1.p1  ORF type:complete len:261 (-),score=64.74 TRINITY_DN12083_c0_g1_i1:99-881(-)